MHPTIFAEIWGYLSLLAQHALIIIRPVFCHIREIDFSDSSDFVFLNFQPRIILIHKYCRSFISNMSPFSFSFFLLILSFCAFTVFFITYLTFPVIISQVQSFVSRVQNKDRDVSRAACKGFQLFKNSLKIDEENHNCAVSLDVIKKHFFFLFKFQRLRKRQFSNFLG